MDIHGVIRISAAAGAAFLTACAPAIRSQRDEAIPVPQGATWAWAEDAGPGAGPGRSEGPGARAERRAPDRGDPTALGAIPRQLFHRAIETALESEGFRKVDRPGEADFLLTLALETARPGSPGRGRAAVRVGVFGGWRRWWGRYHPGGMSPAWISFWPWGGWMWGPWGYGWPVMPYGGAMLAYPAVVAPRGMLVVALLRQRTDDQVAWRAEYRADAYDLAYLTQRHAQEIADRLVASLR